MSEQDTLAVARNIVNQLFDVASVPVQTRQAINDQCDAFVVRLLNHEFARRLRVLGEVVDGLMCENPSALDDYGCGFCGACEARGLWFDLTHDDGGVS